MKSYSAPTIVGLIIILLIICALACLLAWVGMEENIFTSLDGAGAQIYEREGRISLLLKNWLIYVLILFPLILAAAVLLLGYHKTILNRIRNWRNQK